MRLLSKIKSVFGASPENPTTSLANPDDWLFEAFGSGFSDSGAHVSKQSAMQASAVFRSVSILADTVASLPLHVYRRTKDGKEIAADHPTYRLLHDEPNDVMTSFTFYELLMVALLLDGNGYAAIRFGGDGFPREIVPVLPERCDVLITDSGRLAYRVFDRHGNPSVVTAKNMVHIPGLGFDGLKGLSVISAVARQSVGLALTMDKSVSKTHANGVKPSGAVEADKGLTPEAFKRLKSEFSKMYSGADNAGNTVFLDNGMKFQPIQINPADAQTLESRRYQVADIARIFGVPPHMIGETDKTTSWGSGIEQMSMGFVRYSLRPWLVRIEKELNRKLAFGPGYFCEFSLDGLLRGDSKARGEFYASGIQNGWLKPNEARRLENLPPDGAGDRLYANGTIQPLKEAENAD